VFRLSSNTTARLLHVFGATNGERHGENVRLAGVVRSMLQNGPPARVLSPEERQEIGDLVGRAAGVLEPWVVVRLEEPGGPGGFLVLGRRLRGNGYGAGQRVPLTTLAGVFRLAAGSLESASGSTDGRSRKMSLDGAGGESLERMRARQPVLRRFQGRSGAVARILSDVLGVATTNCPVLFEGESGTGKELLASITHEICCGPKAPFEAVNCGAIPEHLVESELFGHVKGAFTGAVRDHRGVFERARGGTVFLDEVGELPVAAQVKLLRVLQEGTFVPVGGEKPLATASRTIAASNGDLQAEVEAGRFRLDLYYRLSVFPIRIPPLRERPEDLPLLAGHLFDRYVAELGRPRPTIHDHAMRRLSVYSYPGNVRELQNIVRSLLVEARGAEVITDRHVIAVFSRHRVAAGEPSTAGAPTVNGDKPDDVGDWVLEQLRRYFFNIALTEKKLLQQRREVANPRSIPVASRSGLTYYLQGECFRVLAQQRWRRAQTAAVVAGSPDLIPRVRGKVDRFLDSAYRVMRKGRQTPQRRYNALRARFDKLPEAYDDDLWRLAEDFDSWRSVEE
jgi:transcriptional regulator with GAF, ATPase, and Fis domain